MTHPSLHILTQALTEHRCCFAHKLAATAFNLPSRRSSQSADRDQTMSFRFMVASIRVFGLQPSGFVLPACRVQAPFIRRRFCRSTLSSTSDVVTFSRTVGKLCRRHCICTGPAETLTRTRFEQGECKCCKGSLFGAPSAQATHRVCRQGFSSAER